ARWSRGHGRRSAFLKEAKRGSRYREIFQHPKGLRIHPADRRREGRVRPHLRSRARRHEYPQRGPEAELRRGERARQVCRCELTEHLIRSAAKWPSVMSAGPLSFIVDPTGAQNGQKARLANRVCYLRRVLQGRLTAVEPQSPEFGAG